MPVNIAGKGGKFEFYTCDHLATGTDLILGIDWLQTNKASLEYSPGCVKFYIGDEEIPLILSGQVQEIKSNEVKVYCTGIPTPNNIASLQGEPIQIEPEFCRSILVSLPVDQTWDKSAHFSQLEGRKIEVPSQIAHVKTTPGKNSTFTAFIKVQGDSKVFGQVC